MPSSNGASRVDKSTKQQSKVIILRLTPELLDRFVVKEPKSESKSTSSAASSPVPPPIDVPTLQVLESTENNSESNSTPAPTQDGSSANDQTKKKKTPSQGTKRAISLVGDGMPKPRGKPGPKKKPRLEDGTIDHSAMKPTVPINTGAVHKLGPKANQGAINAGLRALDRSGKPCRKWARKPFHLKSFTGIVWEVRSWKGGDKAITMNGDDSSDAKDISHQSSSDIKPNESDTAMDSNIGDHLDPTVESTPAASSPAPIPAQPSAITAAG